MTGRVRDQVTYPRQRHIPVPNKVFSIRVTSPSYTDSPCHVPTVHGQFPTCAATVTLPCSHPATGTLPCSHPATGTLPCSHPTTGTLPCLHPATGTLSCSHPRRDRSRPLPRPVISPSAPPPPLGLQTHGAPPLAAARVCVRVRVRGCRGCRGMGACVRACVRAGVGVRACACAGASISWAGGEQYGSREGMQIQADTEYI